MTHSVYECDLCTCDVDTCMHLCMCVCGGVRSGHQLSYAITLYPMGLSRMNCQLESPSDSPVSDPIARIAAGTPAATHGF